MTRTRSAIRPLSLRRFGLTLAAGMTSTLMSAPALAQEATTEEAEDLGVAEYKDVTADSNPYSQEGAPYKARVSGDNRRAKPLAETPATISVVTQTQLKESGRADLRQVLDAQPGITVGTGENGNAFGDRYIIRGQEAKSDVFIDGLRDPGLQSRETFAIEQVEITKGPSATFAGRGASGGAVNGITKQASTEYSFNAIDLTAGTDNHLRATLDSNVRLSDNFALRANLMMLDEDIPDRAPARRKRFGATLAAYGQISEKVAVLVDYYHLTVRDRQDLGQAIANSANGGLPFYDIPAYAQKDDFQNASVNVLTGRIRIDAFGDFKIENMARYGRTTNGYINTSISRFTRGVNDPVAPGAVDYRLQTSRAGWQEIDFFADRLNLAGSFTTGGMKHNLVTGVEFTTYTVDNRFGALNASNTALSVNDTTASGYAYAIAGAPNCITGTGTALNAWCITDGKGNLLSNRFSLWNRTGITKSGAPATIWKVQTLAGYLMDSVDVTDWLTLSGGVRFDSFDFQLTSNNLTTGLVTSDYNYNGTLWSTNAGVSVKPFDDAMLYFAWSTGADVNGGESDVGTNCGYGGLCTASVAGEVLYQGKPERSENLELGAKLELFNERLLLTAAAFRTDKKDIFEGGTNSYLATGSLNSGAIRVEGVELGFAGNLTERLSGQVGASFMKSKVLKSLVDPASVGRRVSNFANTSVDAQLRYQLTDRLALGGTLTYQSEMFAGQPDTGAAWNTTANTYSVRVPGHTALDAFVSFKINPMFSVQLNGQNLTNKTYYTAAYRSGGFAYLGDARSFKATLTAKF